MISTLPTQRVPAPWTLRGEAHVLALWMPPRPERERGSPRAAQNRLGVLGFIRYLESEVGPYDELLWLVPWGAGWNGRRFHTVERIFVSSEASLYNGRLNWGVPKQLATFALTPIADAQRVVVATAEGRLASFLIETRPRSLPLNLTLLPGAARTLGQVLGGQRYEVTPSLRGRAHRARFSELTSDPVRFVDVSAARALGAWSLTEMELHFPEATVRPDPSRRDTFEPVVSFGDRLDL